MISALHESESVEQTELIAADLARQLVGGEVIALEGDLGAGKTQFVRGLVKGLGGDGRAVSSPTFVLLNVYDSGRLPVFHLDAYRVTGADDFEAIGFSELMEQGGIIAVEWPVQIASLLPERKITVRIVAVGESARRIQIQRDQSATKNSNIDVQDGQDKR